MSYRYDTYCGLYCGACEVLQANRDDNLAAVARKWRMKAADITCHGCKSAVLSVYCRDCGIKRCAQGRGVATCRACGRYPCRRIRAFDGDGCAHHAAVMRNLAAIDRIGIKRWLRQQDRRWRCRSCGRRFTWYTKKCRGCDAPVRNAVDEVK